MEHSVTTIHPSRWNTPNTRRCSSEGYEIVERTVANINPFRWNTRNTRRCSLEGCQVVEHSVATTHPPRWNTRNTMRCSLDGYQLWEHSVVTIHPPRWNTRNTRHCNHDRFPVAEENFVGRAMGTHIMNGRKTTELFRVCATVIHNYFLLIIKINSYWPNSQLNFFSFWCIWCHSLNKLYIPLTYFTIEWRLVVLPP